MIFHFIVKKKQLVQLIIKYEHLDNFGSSFMMYQMMKVLAYLDYYWFSFHWNHRCHHFLYPCTIKHASLNLHHQSIIDFSKASYLHLLQIANRLLDQVLSIHLLTLIFLLPHLLYMYSQQNSYLLFYFLLFFFIQEVYGKGLLRRINQSFHYWFQK